MAELTAVLRVMPVAVPTIAEAPAAVPAPLLKYYPAVPVSPPRVQQTRTVLTAKFVKMEAPRWPNVIVPAAAVVLAPALDPLLQPAVLPALPARLAAAVPASRQLAEQILIAALAELAIMAASARRPVQAALPALHAILRVRVGWMVFLSRFPIPCVPTVIVAPMMAIILASLTPAQLAVQCVLILTAFAAPALPALPAPPLPTIPLPGMPVTCSV